MDDRDDYPQKTSFQINDPQLNSDDSRLQKYYSLLQELERVNSFIKSTPRNYFPSKDGGK